MSFNDWKGTWDVCSCSGDPGVTTNNYLEIVEEGGQKQIKFQGSPSAWATGCMFDGVDTSETLSGFNLDAKPFTVYKTVDAAGAVTLSCTVQGTNSSALAMNAKQSLPSKAKSFLGIIYKPDADPDGGSWTAHAGGGGSGYVTQPVEP